MKRALESAGILYPGKELKVIEGFRETDFGVFEYRRYEELKDEPLFVRYIDSGGRMTPPGGEDVRAFEERIEKVVREVFEVCGREGLLRPEEGFAGEGDGGGGVTFTGAVRKAAWEGDGVRSQADAVIVAHGGVIMRMLAMYGVVNKGIYDYQCANGDGFCGRLCLEEGGFVIRDIRPLFPE